MTTAPIYVVHPLDDKPEQKRVCPGLICLTKRQRAILIGLQIYLVFMSFLVLWQFLLHFLY